MKAKPLEISRALLVRTDRIGDVILTIPMATLLKRAHPEIRIAFLTTRYTAPLLTFCPDVDHILLFEPSGRHQGWSGRQRLARKLQSFRFDSAFLFHPTFPLAHILWKSGIPIRVGTAYRWYSILFNHRIREHRKYSIKHELEYNLSLIRPFLPQNFPVEPITFNLRIPEAKKARLQKILQEEGIDSPYAIIHPGSGGSAPNLSVSQYRTIAEFLAEKYPGQLVFTGGVQEKELIQSIGQSIPENKKRNLAGKLTLEDLAMLIAGAELFISGSTGPLHIANAFGVPILSFYCPAPPCSPRRWGPYHQLDWVLTPDVKPCKHCKIARCPHGNCLEKIPTDLILKKLSQRLQTLPGKGKLGR